METQALQIAGGVAVSGALLIWFAKLMAARLIKQYDDKHAEHTKRLEVLSDKFTEHLMDLKLKLAKLEPMVLMAVSMRDDVKSAEGHIAVLKHVVKEKIVPDLNAAHSQIRLINKEVFKQ